MGYYTDLQSGAGLAFAGVMVEVIGSVGSLPAAAVTALSTLGTAFLGIGVVIVGFGLYERFFTSKLKSKAVAETKQEAADAVADAAVA